MVKRHGDSHPVSFRQAGDCHRQNPAQNCRAYFSPKINFGLWIAAELAALATDLAEFLGAALGFYLLFGIPLFLAALITAVVVFLMLAVELYGFRRLEQLIMVFVFAIAGCYAFEMFIVHPDWGAVTARRAGPQNQLAEHLRCREHAGRNRDAACDLSALRAGATSRA